MAGRLFCILFIFLLPFLSYSQINKSFLEKYSPTLLKQSSHLLFRGEHLFVITVSPNSQFRNYIERTPGIFTIYEYPAINSFLVRTSNALLCDKIVTRDDVVFVDVHRQAKEEVAVSNLDISTNRINLMHALYAQFNGDGLHASVKENRPDTADIDLKGRYTSTNSVSPTLSSHATIMSTIMAGAGNSYYEGKGVAVAAGVNSTTFAVLLPEPDNFYQQYGISVQNHSYGTGIENFYAADAAAYDASVSTRPHLLHVFSAGNSGTSASTTGPYANIQGYANITGSFKMSKNILTVGHTDSFGAVLAPSSRGPAFDGRVKPELVAFGEDGSSGAAAIVSGIALNLQHAYKSVNGGVPPAALIKAVLLNTTDDTGAKGIDFNSGYGSANALKAIRSMTAAQYFAGNAVQGSNQAFILNVPANLKQLKITIAWTDPPANVNASKALRNDLDMELSLAAANQTWQPWVLSHFPHVDSLQKLPVRKRDSLNTVEQITIDNPAGGSYTITVKGFNIPSGSQPYFVSYHFDTLNRFNWEYPSRTDNIFSGKMNTIRWSSTYSNTTGQLEYSINNGGSWQNAGVAIDLSKGYYKWNAPDTFSNALLRMSFGSQNFVSDTFSISGRTSTFVGSNCPDSFLFYWNKVKGVQNYQVYKLGTLYMEPLLVTTDTLVVLAKASNPALYYAVAPLINGRAGLRSYGFDYANQGVGCYIKSFFATLTANTPLLQLELGINYNIKNIRWEKMTTNGPVTLQTMNIVSGVTHSYIDPSPTQGVNIYRVRIELLNGQVIYSDQEPVYYFGDRSYIIYPNPVSRDQTVTILLKDLRPTTIQVFDIMGRKCFETSTTNPSLLIPTSGLSKGMYILRISINGRSASASRLLIQ